MSAKYFLDTNIFVYSFDPRDSRKRQMALSLINHALQTGEGLISTQVMQEFINVATRKFTPPIQAADCKLYLEKVLNPLCQIYPDLRLFNASLDIQNQTGYSFYDSLILAGARHGGCTVLYSEDLQDGQLIDGLQIINPFTQL